MTPPRPVFIYRADGRLDYPAMRNAATKGTLSSRQIRAAAERAARKAAKADEGTKLPPALLGATPTKTIA